MLETTTKSHDACYTHGPTTWPAVNTQVGVMRDPAPNDRPFSMLTPTWWGNCPLAAGWPEIILPDEAEIIKMN